MQSFDLHTSRTGTDMVEMGRNLAQALLVRGSASFLEWGTIYSSFIEKFRVIAPIFHTNMTLI